jgi:hypothetical protein
MKKDIIKDFLKQSNVVKVNGLYDDNKNIFQCNLADGEILQLYLSDESMMFFVQVGVLNDLRFQSPEVFIGLLSANNLGGRLYNQRISYDDVTSAVYICHDTYYKKISCAKDLDDELELFIENSRIFASIIKSIIIEPLENSVEDNY